MQTSIGFIIEDHDTSPLVEPMVYIEAWRIVGQLILDLFVSDQSPEEPHTRDTIVDGYMYLIEMGKLPSVLTTDCRHTKELKFIQLCTVLFDQHHHTLFQLMNQAERSIALYPNIHHITARVERGRYWVVALYVDQRLLLEHIPTNSPMSDDGFIDFGGRL